MDSRSAARAGRRRVLISTSSGILSDIGALDPVVLVQQDGETILAIIHGHHAALAHHPQALARQRGEIRLRRRLPRAALCTFCLGRAVGATPGHQGEASQPKQRLATIALILHVPPPPRSLTVFGFHFNRRRRPERKRRIWSRRSSAPRGPSLRSGRRLGRSSAPLDTSLGSG